MCRWDSLSVLLFFGSGSSGRALFRFGYWDLLVPQWGSLPGPYLASFNNDKNSKVGVEVELEDLSREELIACLTKATIPAKSKGSAPTSGNDKSHLSIFDEEESTSEDSSQDSGSNDQSSDESKDGAGSG